MKANSLMSKLNVDNLRHSSDVKRVVIGHLDPNKLPYLFGYKTGVSPLQNDYK